MNTQTAVIPIRINGEDREVPVGLTVRDLLVELGLQPEMIVVEQNREILARVLYSEVEVGPGDTLELVHFVGGG